MKYLYFAGKVDTEIASKEYFVGNYFKNEEDAFSYYHKYECTILKRYSEGKFEHFDFQKKIWVSERNW